MVMIAAPAALAWAGKPANAPPAPPNPGGPPPAWVETQTQSAWLAYGSYCWTGNGKATCADMIPPQDRPALPVVGVKRGRLLRVHLGFTANSVEVSLNGHLARAKLNSSRRIVSWNATRSGILTVFTRGVGGDASYVARLRLH